jgi:two-component system chemotaxis sensor kinase CheA
MQTQVPIAYTASAELKSAVERLAEDLVMLDADDPREVVELGQQLLTVSGELASALPAVADAAREAAAMLDRLALGDSADPDADLDRVSALCSCLQATVCQGRPVVTGECSRERTDTVGDPRLPTFEDRVDDEILQLFIEQQETAVAVLDESILAFERDGDHEHLARLRRVLHTMKGEAGVVGFEAVAAFCHLVEDYLESCDEPSADLLLESKDWLAAATGGLEGRDQTPPESLTARLAGASEPEVPAEPVTPDSGTVSGKQPRETMAVSEPELTRDFLGEAAEHLEAADENLLVLESDPGDRQAVAVVFRAFHTIKGVAGFLNLGPIADLAHEAETLLNEVREGRTAFSGPVADAVFQALDLLRTMLDDLGNALRQGQDCPVAPDAPRVRALLGELLRGESSDTEPPDVAVPAGGEAPADNTDPPQPEPVASDPVPAVAPAGSRSQATAPPNRNGLQIRQNLKVDAEKLDTLIDTIGELVIAESIVSQDPAIRTLNDRRLGRNLSQLNKITRQLQDIGMAMRMVPVEAVFRKMSRLVRDLAKSSGKAVDLVVRGKETELDRSMVDSLGDPLIHMIRNSVDHGIEASAEDRVSGGKPATATILLHAFHKGGSIHIQVSDDGRGLDRDAIAERALERGLVTSTDGMPDAEIWDLIFQPGFSTAKKVTEISGRGVGMDVVRRNVEELRGKVRVESSPGRGTTFTLVLPLTTAIIDGMLVRVGQETYVVPTLAIVETLRLEPGRITQVTGRGQVVSFRGSLLALFSLATVFGVPSSDRGSDSIVMVVEDAGRQVALLVDELLDQQQIVIKSLGSGIAEVPGVSGVSILADGRPGLILDIAGLVRLATS